MSVDIDKLKDAIEREKKTLEVVADEIGIDRSTFYRKMKNGGETFNVREVQALFEKLSLTNDEAISIFFKPIVAKMRQLNK